MNTLGDARLATSTTQSTAADCLQSAFLRRVGFRQLLSPGVNDLNLNSIDFHPMGIVRERR
jgi:hypothetical protein